MNSVQVAIVYIYTRCIRRVYDRVLTNARDEKCHLILELIGH